MLKSLVNEKYHEFITNDDDVNGQIVFNFKNGYGASLVNHYGSYGNEMAVLKFESDGRSHLCYDTHITDDVLGYLDKEDINTHLEAISKL